MSLLLFFALVLSAEQVSVSDSLRSRIEASGVAASLVIGDEPVLAAETVSMFYAERFYQPAWIVRGEVSRAAFDLFVEIRAATRHGLDPADYHLDRIELALEQARVPGTHPRALVDLELLLTDAFLVYGSHLLDGAVEPVRMDPEWHVEPSRRRELLTHLASASSSGRVREAIESLAPRVPQYPLLQRALARYRDLAEEGGWFPVPDGPKLEPGSTSDRVRAVAARLRVTGDAGPEVAGGSELGQELVEAVKRFQRRHGLDEDGVVGERTLEAMNVSAPGRARQIELSLERWRWLSETLGQRYISVNIPAFELELVEDERRVLGMRVVVGGPYRSTPIFSSRMTYVVLSPYWHVPPTIAIQDVLPEVRRDPSYLEENDLRVFDGWGADAREIDPRTIDWREVNPRYFPYRFQQEPGPRNPLGKVKFMFPNRYHVYLHDSPNRSLFARAERSFSSGCIRLEKALELAERLLGEDWSRERIEEVVQRGEEHLVPLPAPIDVHLLYLTSWVNDDGQVHFRRDLYGRDAVLDEALRARPSRWVVESN